MQIDLNILPYKHRSSAASMLISKGNRLTGLMSLSGPFTEHSETLTDKQIAKMREGLSYYDMALSLMKLHDPNYQTLLKWKCLALMELGQYREAREWYGELVRIDIASQGEHNRSATAQLALDQLKTLEGKENEPLPQLKRLDVEVFDDPPFCATAEQFCLLLSDGKFKKAFAYLMPALKQQLSVADLKQSWKSMVGASQADVDLYLERYEIDPPNSSSSEIGWCYFVVSNEEVNEAVSMTIELVGNAHGISALEFGRP